MFQEHIKLDSPPLVKWQATALEEHMHVSEEAHEQLQEDAM